MFVSQHTPENREVGETPQAGDKHRQRGEKGDQSLKVGKARKLRNCVIYSDGKRKECSKMSKRKRNHVQDKDQSFIPLPGVRAQMRKSSQPFPVQLAHK